MQAETFRFVVRTEILHGIRGHGDSGGIGGYAELLDVLDPLTLAFSPDGREGAQGCKV